MQSEHIPKGNPCLICRLPLYRHRVYHRPIGNPCVKCGLLLSQHRFSRPDPVRIRQQFRAYPIRSRQYIGIDGEGQGSTHHKYVFLAAANETGTFRRSVSNDDGLSTVECLDFLLSLPYRRVRCFTYAFQYDLTKILTDVDDKSLYLLFRPELRGRQSKPELGPIPVTWNGYSLNLQATKFSVAKDDKKFLEWDIFKFFQSKFVGALEDWQVLSEHERARMSEMKDQRAEFDKLNPKEVEEYCFTECQGMATLARKLTEAHAKAGLKLQSYYGAGSSAAAMLKRMHVKQHIEPIPKEMEHAVASAFFGGRFENSVIGSIKQEIFSFDISSAYPYQLTFLPCLKHSVWHNTKRREDLNHVQSAIVRYALPTYKGIVQAIAGRNAQSLWGPFPFRTDDGCISFPISSGGGWIGKDEFLQGEKCFQNVRFREAWICETSCDCVPFKQIPSYYLERCRIGKEGPGIVIKLGCNSCYGKLAQSVGNAPFQCWIWAVLITSGTRAQLLELLGMHKDWRNVLMMATDGICTLEDIQTPLPTDTGTAEFKKPLGGWERKLIPRGMFFSRPGIYFPLNPTEKELTKIRARGIGRKVLFEQWQKIITSYERFGIEETVCVDNVRRFCGAKTSIHRSGKPGEYVYRRANSNNGHSPSYGNWITRPVEMSFDPMPKRKGVLKDGLHLEMRRFPKDLESVSYKRARMSSEALAIKVLTDELLEQPDVDWSAVL